MGDKGKKITLDPYLAAVCAAVIAFVAVFPLVNLWKFRLFSTSSFGWAYLHIYPKLASFQNPFSLFTLPEFNVVILLAPLNYLVAFLYAVFPRAATIFVFQALFLSAGAVPLYLLSRRKLGSRLLASAVSFGYLTHPLIVTGLMLGYTPLAMGIFFFLAAFYYLETERLGRFSFCILLAALSKIDAAAIAALFGIILYSIPGKRRFAVSALAIGAFTAFLSGISALGYLAVIHRDFPVGLLHFDRYGTKVGDALNFASSRPLAVASNIFNPGNFVLEIFLGLPGIFFLACPLFVLAAVPEAAFLLLRNQHSTGHYLVLAFVFLGAVCGLERLQRCGALFRNPSFLRGFSILILAASLAQYYYFKPHGDFAANLGYPPFSRGFHFSDYRQDRHSRIGTEVLKLIPDSSSCLTMQSLAGHLGRIEHVGVLARYVIAERYKWDYILVDLSKSDFYHLTPQEYYAGLAGYMANGYNAVFFEDGWLLLHLGGAGTKNLEALRELGRLSRE